MKWKQIFHRINIILTLILAVLGAGHLLCLRELGEELWMLGAIGGAFLLVMAFIALVTGALRPEQDSALPDKYRKPLKAVILLNLLLNKSTAGAGSAYELAEGGRRVRRCWEPLLPFVWLLLQSIFSVMLLVGGEGSIRLLSAGALIGIFLLLIGSVCWRAADNLEREGSFRWGSVFLPVLTAAIIFLIGGVYAFAKESRTGNHSRSTAEEIQRELEEALEQQEYLPEASDYRNILQVREQIKEDFREEFQADTVYYRIQAGGSTQKDAGGQEYEAVNFVAWCREEEAVIVYCYHKYEGGYVLDSAFLSNAINKEDLEGTEDGSIS